MSSPDTAVAMHRDVALGLAESMPRPDNPLVHTTIDASRQAVVDSAREKLAHADVESGLKIIAGDVVPYRPEETRLTLIQKLSTARDADGRKVAPTTDIHEVSRVNSAQNEVNKAVDFLEKGKVNPDLAKALAGHLYSNSPVLHDLFDSMGGVGSPQALQYVQGLMRQSGFRESLRQRFIEVMNPRGAKLEGEGMVTSIEAAVKALEAKLTLVPDKVAIAGAKTTLDTAKAARIAVDSDIQRLEEVKNLRAPLEANIAIARRNVTTLPTDARYLAAEAEVTNIAADMTVWLADATHSRGDKEYVNLVKQRDAALRDPILTTFKNSKDTADNYDAFSTEITTLKGKVDKIVGDEAAAKEAYDSLIAEQKGLTREQQVQLESELAVKKRELADARDDLQMEMITFHRDATHMAQDAMDTALSANFDAAKSTWKEEAQAGAEKAKTLDAERAKNAADKVVNLWKKQVTYRPNFLERKFRIGANSFKIWETQMRKVDPFMGKLMHGGPEEVIAFIESRPTTELTGAALTADEITAFQKMLKDDSEFRNAQATRLSKELVADYFTAGGTMTRPVVTAMVSTPWGVAMFDNAVVRSKEVLEKYPTMKDQMEELNQARSEGRLGEHLTHHYKKYLGLLGLILSGFGYGVGVGMGPAAAITAAPVAGH